MIEIVRALIGGRACRWCYERDPSWFDRMMRYDRLLYMHERRWYERVWLRVEFWIDQHLPLWRIAERWHRRRHGPGQIG